MTSSLARRLATLYMMALGDLSDREQETIGLRFVLEDGCVRMFEEIVRQIA